MTEFVDKDGFVRYRFPKHKTVSKHRFLYQQYNNCTLTPNEVVIFLDNNNRNFNPENLYKVTRGELVLLNRWYKISSDPNETLDRIAIIRLKQKRIELAKKAGLTNNNGQIRSDIRDNQKRWYDNHPEKRLENNKKMREWRKKKMQDPVWREENNRKRRIKRNGKI